MCSSVYNTFQGLSIKINEAEANIDSTLRKRYDLLHKAAKIFESHDESQKILEQITSLKSKKISNFDLDRKLYDALVEYTNYLEVNNELKTNENIVKIDYALNESEQELIAYRGYYNSMITVYNKKVKKFPSSFLALTFRFKIKNYYDNKDMTDEDINDFKL